MARLTEQRRDEFGNADIIGMDMTDLLALNGVDLALVSYALNKLAYYEDAEEEGRLMVFPVAIGDHVYCFPSETEHYREMQVYGLDRSFSGKHIYVQDVITCETVYFDTDSLGRSLFKTLDEAEAKLKEMES